MNILGIDTSCDDTSAAVVQDGQKVLSMVVTSQDQFHQKYGGVVPEIASRKHLELIIVTIQEALDRAQLTLDDIDGVAVTDRPGLIGSLVVGIAAAKSIAYTRQLPLTAVNHLQGHAYALTFFHELTFPHLALVVSGGHTLTAIIDQDWRMTIIGHTRDDAAGECLDKVSKMLDLGYPGGKIIDQMAKKGNPNAFTFPRPMIKDPSPHFSFSGLKTAVKVFLENNEKNKIEPFPPDVVASVQEAVMDVLVVKTHKTAQDLNLSLITVSGGVAANSRLRELFAHKAAATGFRVLFPPPEFCTDNAAVMGGLGFHQIRNHELAGLELNGKARVSMK
ncbi:tRNA (adenosine(37)-N6)-threonylcarbamoyltransferase complex transferase subunit TsaD [candidate division CSSED10-310 bacterium]|uniref:tRNA N6-adenosine threonylcarbamoyltransferase n=1 Tax=candidate division CSSED10-310 bacterium TaxID=2855610 RepID=A0ABV6YYW7_UNCC1